MTERLTGSQEARQRSEEAIEQDRPLEAIAWALLAVAGEVSGARREAKRRG